MVICEEVPGSGASVSEMSSQLAAEVIRDHFAGGLPDLPRPLLWIERRPARRGRRERYFLLTFPSYTPKPEAPGFVRRVTLGPPEREPLAAEEVAALTGGAPVP